MTDYSTIQQDVLDRFIDDLDYARQDGRIAEVVVPQLAVDLAAGKLFGELTCSDVDNLAQQASRLGQRRADVIRVMWQDMQRKKKAERQKWLQPRSELDRATRPIRLAYGRDTRH